MVNYRTNTKIREYTEHENERRETMAYQVVYDLFPKNGIVRFLETDEDLRVGEFIQLVDEDESLSGNFLIVETGPPSSVWGMQGKYNRLYLFPLSLLGGNLKKYKLVANAPP